MKLQNSKIYAHRGARAIAPENTIPAFQAALDMGVSGIELDVHCSKDGQLVVIHDFTVDALTDGTGPIHNYTTHELAQLDAGSHFDQTFAGIGCEVNVEIKSMDPYGGDQVEPLIKTMQDRQLYDQILVSSFSPITLIKMRVLAPDTRIGFLHEKLSTLYAEERWLGPLIQPEAVHPYHSLADDAYMQWAKDRSYAVNTWTVNDPVDAQRLAALGVDVIMSDVPDLITGNIDHL